MARLAFKPIVITAFLQQGVSIDPRHGVALDGLLTASMRASSGRAQGITSGSQLDGGLSISEPIDWDLPLGKCEEDLSVGWHWLATSGQPIDFNGLPIKENLMDPHRLMVRLDERRAEEIAISMPKNVGGPRGRYRTRVTPVMVTICSGITWHAFGDPDKIEEFLEPITTLGARRGSGEGSVNRWKIEVINDKKLDNFVFSHTNPDGSLGRPLPQGCVDRLGLDSSLMGYAGLRPPMFHSARQHLLVLPKN